MKGLINTILVLLLPVFLNAQYYTVTAFQDEYTEIDNYQSIMKETMGDRSWGKRFELNFDFPYFDQLYNYLSCDNGGICTFDDDIDFSIRLFAFGYQCDNVWDSINIPSDVRYSLITKDGLKALVVQFTKNRLHSDDSVEEYDSHVNFQWWFFENGTIELRFGPSNLEHSRVYVPGEGFYLWTTNHGPLPSGPQIALYHPYEESIKLEYGDLDSYAEFEISRTSTTDWMPPDGWVIRFENDYVGIKEPDGKEDVYIYPNPVFDIIYIQDVESIQEIIVKNISGQIVKKAQNANSINVSDLSQGMYLIEIVNKHSTIVKRVVKL